MLNRLGEATVQQLVDELTRLRSEPITAVTVRHHLHWLLEEQLVVAHSSRQLARPGRPQQIEQRAGHVDARGDQRGRLLAIDGVVQVQADATLGVRVEGRQRPTGRAEQVPAIGRPGRERGGLDLHGRQPMLVTEQRLRGVFRLSVASRKRGSGSVDSDKKRSRASVAHGLDPDLVTDVEGEQAVQTAARDIARTIQSYVETYPFVRDGLEIYVVQCRNGSLPGSLVERLDQIGRRRGWNLRINLIVHTTDRGAPLFQRISEWIRSNEQFAEKLPGRYFPQVTMKVLECSFDELFEQVGDTDLVILADVLAERGQSVRARLVQPDATKALPAWEYIPFTRNVMRPFERRERLREIDLYPADQPALFRYFYNLQWAAYERRAAPVDEVVQFYLEISLTDWEHDLNRLHQQFNWVVCYDPTVDRFLLQATCEETVQVIRYSLGLGPKRRHNMTVSSSRRAQDIVVQRLGANLKQLLPTTPSDFREKIAIRLVEEAKSISGDIVLRAAGPGAYLNELIGMIVAKTETERRYRESNPNAVTAWIYLDDFAHWFERKFPDLLFVAIDEFEVEEHSLIHVEVIETKCVGEMGFNSEATDAQRQVAQGVNSACTGNGSRESTLRCFLLV
ncbi:hypothetical protein HC928_22815 [bacterium]|nr:hypothetical protein [bacterium]